MAFEPKISVIELPRNSKYVTIKDATGDYDGTSNLTGWGCPGGPADIDALENVAIQLQYFGELPIAKTGDSLEGTLEDGLQITHSLLDGIYLIRTFYGITLADVNPAISEDELTLTVTERDDAFALIWDNVKAVASPGAKNTLFRIKSMDKTTGEIELYEAYTDGDSTDIVAYFEVVKRVLILNCGEGNIVKDISNMSISQTGCDNSIVQNLMNRIMLKMTAQTAFTCGNYTKAHEAAVLLCSMTSPFKTCSTC